MKIELKDLPVKLKAIAQDLQRYSVIIFATIMLVIYGFLIFRVGTIAGVEPNEEAVTEQLKDAQRLRVDTAAVNKIQQLEDQNIAVKSLFKSARDNPFQEN